MATLESTGRAGDCTGAEGLLGLGVVVEGILELGVEGCEMMIKLFCSET